MVKNNPYFNDNIIEIEHLKIITDNNIVNKGNIMYNLTENIKMRCYLWILCPLKML